MMAGEMNASIECSPLLGPQLMDAVQDIAAGRDIPNVTTVHHGSLPTNADGVHFNAEGQIELGKMTASAIEEFYKAKE